MARSYNKITLVGNIGRDPDLQTTTTGTKVAHASLATNRRIPADNEDGYVERTDWHRITFWGKLAQLAEDHIGQGDRVLVEGSLEYSSYERDGVTIPTSEITVREVVLLSPKEAR